MRPERRWNQETAVRVAAFGALAALAGAQWMRLVESPPVGRVAIAVGVATAAAALIATIAAVQPRATARALAAVTALVATAAGLVWIGIPAHLLDPGSWGELLDEIGGGFSVSRATSSTPTTARTSGRATCSSPASRSRSAWPPRSRSGPAPSPSSCAAPLRSSSSSRPSASAPRCSRPSSRCCGARCSWARSSRGCGFPTSRARRDRGDRARRARRRGRAPVAGAGLRRAVARFPRVGVRPRKPAKFDWNHRYGPRLAARGDGARGDGERQAAVLEALRSRPVQRHALAAPRSGGRPAPRAAAAGRGVADRRTSASQAQRAVGRGDQRDDRADGEQVRARRRRGRRGRRSRRDRRARRHVDRRGETLTEGDEYSLRAYAPDPNPTRLRDAPENYAPTLARYTEFTVPDAGGGGVAEGTDVQVRCAAARRSTTRPGARSSTPRTPRCTSLRAGSPRPSRPRSTRPRRSSSTSAAGSITARARPSTGTRSPPSCSRTGSGTASSSAARWR